MVGIWKTTKQFYNSKRWNLFRLNVIARRSMETNGEIHCEYCGKVIAATGDVELDHIKELTKENLNDVCVSLNPDNVKIACHNCHNKKHNRFGSRQKGKVYIVYGPPCSGKSSYIKENMIRGDIVVDIDRLFSAVSFLDLYDKPEALKYNVFELRNLLIDNIKTRYGKFFNAWIVGGYTNKHDRERLAEDLGAELVLIDTSKEECLHRLETCNDCRQYQRNEWAKYINKWFDDFEK